MVGEDRGEPLRASPGRWWSSPGRTAAVIEITQRAGGELLEDLGVGVDAVGAEEGAVLDRVRTDGERVARPLGRRGRARRGAARRRAPPRRATASSARPNWDSWGPTVGVMLPPLAITLMTSTPRATRSRTAWRTPSGPSTSPPRNQQCPLVVVIGGPEATMRGPTSLPARNQSRRVSDR